MNHEEAQNADDDNVYYILTPRGVMTAYMLSNGIPNPEALSDALDEAIKDYGYVYVRKDDIIGYL